jgi:hypothetical protein|tara:strand:- start:344 stop:718 length:375 start_codon:yes stop_codon:yes gene_type:complete
MTDLITIKTSEDGVTIWLPAGVNVKTVAPKVVEQRKIETVAKPRAVAKVKGKRKRLLNGMTCQDAILDVLTQRDATPKGLARLTGYGMQTCFAAIHLLRAEGHKIEKVKGRNGKYRYWGQRHGL